MAAKVSEKKRQTNLELRSEAEDILLETGAVDRCPNHYDVLLIQGTTLAVWRARTMAVELVEAAGGDPMRLLQEIRDALAGAVDDCPHCKGNRL